MSRTTSATPLTAQRSPAAEPPKPPHGKQQLKGEPGVFARMLKGLAAPQPELALAPPPQPQAQPHAAHEPTPRHGQRDEKGEHDEKEVSAEPPVAEAPMDPADATWAHRSALMAPPIADAQLQAQHHVEHVARHASIEQLAPQLLRKMAWSGDGKRGAARLEVGSGSLAGAVLTLEADGRDVSLAIDGVDAQTEHKLRARLQRGLGDRGFRLT